MTLREKIERLRPEIAKRAQAIVDAWVQDEEGLDEELGEGGICDRVSTAIAETILDHVRGVDVTDGGQDGDDHAYPIIFDDRHAFAVDIPPGVYETGGGYRWKKRKDARITAEDVVIDPVRRSDLGLARGRAGRAEPYEAIKGSGVLKRKTPMLAVGVFTMRLESLLQAFGSPAAEGFEFAGARSGSRTWSRLYEWFFRDRRGGVYQLFWYKRSSPSAREKKLGGVTLNTTASREDGLVFADWVLERLGGDATFAPWRG